MTVRVYRSTDAGAPKRTGALGNDAAILKACLVAGYGSKAGAGWGNPFSATNIEVFRPPAGNRRYLRVDDSIAGYPYCSVYRGYETMSAVSDGVNPMPSNYNGVAISRSTGGESATDRPWVVIATEKCFYFFAAVYNLENERAYPQMMFYGDIESFVPGDQYNTALIGNGLTDGYSTSQAIAQGSSSTTTLNSYHVMARKFDQQGASIGFGKQGDPGKQGTSALGAGSMQYPNPADGGFYLTPIWVHEQGASTSFGVLRGLMPGMWGHCHPPATVRLHDQVDGSGAMAGKKIEFFTFGSQGDVGSVGIEISDTW